MRRDLRVEMNHVVVRCGNRLADGLESPEPMAPAAADHPRVEVDAEAPVVGRARGHILAAGSGRDAGVRPTGLGSERKAAPPPDP
jgi:hypothetical protein